MKRSILIIGIIIIFVCGCKNSTNEVTPEPILSEGISFNKISIFDYPDYNNPQILIKHFNYVPIYDNTVYIGDTIIIHYNYSTGYPVGYKYTTPPPEWKINEPVIVTVKSKSGDSEDYILKKGGTYSYIGIEPVGNYNNEHTAIINYYPVKYQGDKNSGYLVILTPVDTLTAIYNSPYNNSIVKTQICKIIIKRKQ